jgi:hypothetical protein
MKYLLLPFLLLGCSANTIVIVDSSQLKYRAGDVVVTTDFYSDCLGTVVGYLQYKDPMGPNQYSVDFLCGIQNIKDVIVAETALRKK